MSSRPDIDRGHDLQALTWSMTAVSFVFLVLRFWARLSKRAIGIDDAFMLFSWLLFLACTVVFTFLAKTGGTRHIEYLTLVEIQYQLKLAIINLPMAIAVTAFGKMAIGVTILRIVGNTSPRKRLSIWVMLTILVTASVVDIFLGLFQCGAPQNQWSLTPEATAKCLPSYVFANFNYFTIAVQAFSDYFFSVLPMAVVWNLQMKLRRKLTIMFLLSLTLVTGAVGTAKLVNQVNFSNTDLTGGTYKVALLFSLEVMFIIVFGSMPVLNPLWEQCVEIKHPKTMSRLLGSSKQFSLGSSNKQTAGQSSLPVAASQNSKWLPDGNTELASLTGYPQQPAVSIKGGGKFSVYPHQSTVPFHGGEQFSGYPQQSAVSVPGGGELSGYSQHSVVPFHGGSEVAYPQETVVFDHTGQGLQDERPSHSQTPGVIYIEHQVHQNITPQDGRHGNHGY